MTLICAAGTHCRCGCVCKVAEKHYFCTLNAMRQRRIARDGSVAQLDRATAF